MSRLKAGAEISLLQPTVFTCWVNSLLPTPLTILSLSEQWPAEFCAQLLVWQALVTVSCSWDQTDLGRVEAVVKMEKGRAEPELTHIGAFSPGQSRPFSGPSAAHDHKHTGQQQRERERGWPQPCLASTHTQTETTCERAPLHTEHTSHQCTVKHW